MLLPRLHGVDGKAQLGISMNEIPSWNGSMVRGQKLGTKVIHGRRGHVDPVGGEALGATEQWCWRWKSSRGRLVIILVEGGFPRSSERLDKRMKGWDRVLRRLPCVPCRGAGLQGSYE